MSLWAMAQVETKHRRRTPTLADTFLTDPSFGGSSSRAAPSSPSKGVLKKSVYVVHPYTREVGQLSPRAGDEETATLPNSPVRDRLGKARGTPAVCNCQWEWGWNKECPLHGVGARKNAKMASRHAVAGSGGYNGADFAWENVEPEMETHAHDLGFEVQRHAGVGNAVSGVKKDEKGWWKDKGVTHDGEKKVGFQNNELPDDFEDEREVERMASGQIEVDMLGKPVASAPTSAYWKTERIIGRENVFEDKLGRARGRLEESSQRVVDIEKEVTAATGVLRESGIAGNGGKGGAAAERRKAQLNKLAEDAASWKRPNVMPDHSKVIAENGGAKSRPVVSQRPGLFADRSKVVGGNAPPTGREHMPSHVRAGYERDIDKLGFARRVGQNMRHEHNHAEWLNR